MNHQEEHRELYIRIGEIYFWMANTDAVSVISTEPTRTL
jgi:hypothetical protein